MQTWIDHDEGVRVIPRPDGEFDYEPINKRIFEAMKKQAKCPRCNSPQPHKHPAVQSGGEVQICPHAFHASKTA